MSRKDPRRLMLLPLDAAMLAALRARRRPGRSLADVARRLLQETAPVTGLPIPTPIGPPIRHLPLQLPARLRLALAARATDHRLTPEELAARLLAASLGVPPVAEAPHAEPHPDRGAGADP